MYLRTETELRWIKESLKKQVQEFQVDSVKRKTSQDRIRKVNGKDFLV